MPPGGAAAVMHTRACWGEVNGADQLIGCMRVPEEDVQNDDEDR